MTEKIFIASYAPDGGVYSFDFNGGVLTKRGFVPLPFPMYLCKQGNKLYVTAGCEEKGETGKLYSLDIVFGKLENLTELGSTEGVAPCHLSAAGENVYVANYATGNVIMFPEKKTVAHDGKGVNPERQESAHPHMAAVTPDGKYVLVCDLGLDSVFCYDRDLNSVSRASVPEGYGPRHAVTVGNYVYCVNELAPSISTFVLGDGKLEYAGTENYPTDGDEKINAAAIEYDEKRKTLYVSNRGANTLAAFSADGRSVKYKYRVDCKGDCPRDFALSGDGDYLICANLKSNSVSVFLLDEGEMRFVSAATDISAPMCVIKS